ncbi:MAG: Phosphoribosyltransferase [Candidatus Falkowbacteria bacterium GW2011_GWD2_38_42]|uniref:Phosphoribosyltransferase n=1 Tax=Candidatus Falkowbacteria bacterium GW2011_GWE1_38_31 TaxID=1618638 RepID=A0A0G0M8F0_9BACT|nr:MAG: Phosphoribosyltransferase [Candidatus Falkowbacteria bacterium GW2011_GWF1_38_22]KKQ65377.1 MAG: Phosphoribosyltransferase [Candidatus Falkowbacteria bacterium GW2011_GWE2_38_254]KKQ69954.1 MAG: Phosphoribosyltransferase [Candidatus Falkowbacteria bacterium GW2011_GWE1_38_31]KKQ72518.1 MAG: Phosphoribosyltransferase [Candidatus Falkowbacteria bacterium GW2011_GWD2_38_42]
MNRQCCPECKTENRYGEFCQKCQSRFYLKGILVAGSYKNPLLSKLIKQMKYHFTRDIALVLGDFLILFLRNHINQKNLKSADILAGSVWRAFAEIKNAPPIFNKNRTLIIPVPLHAKRLRWRGYNQAEELAKIVAKKMDYDIRTDILIRKKYNKPQAKLSHDERLQNIQNCFQYKGSNLHGINIILIDDVATTASTLNECAKELKQNGADEVWGLVVAKG